MTSLACTIDLAPTGAAVLSIPDAAGEMIAYRLGPCLPGLSAWAVTVTRLDSGDSHRVSRERGGWWRCSCLDRKYRRGQKPRGCKHIAAARAVEDFVATFRGTHERQP